MLADPRNQAMFKRPMNCEYDPVCKVRDDSLNDWNFVMATEKQGGYVAQEMSDLHEDALAERFTKVEGATKIGSFGAISCKAGIDMLQLE